MLCGASTTPQIDVNTASVITLGFKAKKENRQLNCHLNLLFGRYISAIWTATHSPLCRQ